MELDEEHRHVLRVLAAGRANPYLIREETGLGKGTVNTRLNQLGRNGYVGQVTTGLYEITEKGRSELGLSAVTLDEKTLDRARQALDDLEAALERGDHGRAEDALERARAALEGER